MKTFIDPVLLTHLSGMETKTRQRTKPEGLNAEAIREAKRKLLAKMIAKLEVDIDTDGAGVGDEDELEQLYLLMNKL